MHGLTAIIHGHLALAPSTIIVKKRHQGSPQWRFRLQRLFYNYASMKPKSRDTNRPMLGTTNGMFVALTPNHFAKVAAY